jgi:N-acetylmuramic acid 6-phosphate (MurNAc-6-P) etherase
VLSATRVAASTNKSKAASSSAVSSGSPLPFSVMISPLRGPEIITASTRSDSTGFDFVAMQITSRSSG